MDLQRLKIFKDTLQQLSIAVVICLLVSIGHAGKPGKPLWTFTPHANHPPTVSITPLGSATIKYTVTNQSHKIHTLVMKPIVGITQIIKGGNCPNPFTLGYQQSCILHLFVNGGELTHDIMNGPVVCQQGNLLQCYQPSWANALNITQISGPLVSYVITPTAEANGVIKPSTPQTVVAGSSFTFTAKPISGYQVDHWLVDGGVAQKGGVTFTLSHIVANHSVDVTFTRAGTLYAGTLKGHVYFSNDNGLNWTTATAPSPGYAVNSVFATARTLYVGSADGKVYYSTNNGVSWHFTPPVPKESPVNSVFVIMNGTPTIYAGTQDGNIYYSTNSTPWTSITKNLNPQAVNSIFITPSNTIYIGSEDGNLYYLNDSGLQWNQISGPPASVPIQNVFVANNKLYINTRQTSSNDTLPPGTIDFEYAYSSNEPSDPNPIWTIFSQITYTLFVNSDASVIHAGTQNGYVFSLTTGDELGFITYSPITSLFFLE